VAAFCWPKEVAPSDWTHVILPALPRLRAVHRVAVSLAALNKQTNNRLISNRDTVMKKKLN
jgi:hypothetical protein